MFQAPVILAMSLHFLAPTCPPAAQAATRASRPSSLISLLAAVVTRRQPVAPKGWPIEREPPQRLNLSRGISPSWKVGGRGGREGEEGRGGRAEEGGGEGGRAEEGGGEGGSEGKRAKGETEGG